MNLTYLLVSYGICFGIQNKVPSLRKIHPIAEAMISCTYCLGTHTGWMTWLLAWAVSGSFPAAVDGALAPSGWAVLASVAVWSMASAAFCYAMDALVQWLENHSA